MAERIDIEITDKISVSVRKKLVQIADAAKRGYTSINKLNAALDDLNATALSKLSTASAKVTNALSRETTATAKLTAANAKMKTSTAQAALSQQRLATETQRTAAAQSRNLAASSRAEIAALRLKTAKDKLTNSQHRLRSSTSRTAKAMGDFVKRLIAFELIRRTITNVIRLADAYTLLQNKLKNVTESTEQLAEVTKEVFAVARRSRTAVGTIAQSFQRFDMALKPLGASQKEVLELTETISKALVVSGATTSEQTASLLQLSQAFNKGKLDGDEFRTVMETMPILADAIAKQLKVTRGELLELAPQGKITGEVMRAAFASAREEINDKFAKALPTVGQALTVLTNNVTKFVGKLDKATGFTNKLASAIITLSENLEELTIVVKTLGIVMLVAFGPKLLTAIAAATTAAKGFIVLAASIAAVIKTMDSALSAYNETLKAKGLEDDLDVMKMRLRLIKQMSDEELKAYNLRKGFSAEGSASPGLRPASVSTGAKVSKKSEEFNKFDALQDIINETEGASKKLKIQAEGVALAFSAGVISADEYIIRLNEINMQTAELKLQMGDSTFADTMLEGLRKVTDGYQGVLGTLTNSFGDFFKSLTDGFANSIGQAIVYSKDLGTSLISVARGALAEFISQLTKAFIQKQLISSVQGGSDGGIGGVLAGAFGFAEGGYTGNIATNEVAGVVHGKEFVMDAAATSRIGVGNLQAMQKGAPAAGTNSNTATTAPAVQGSSQSNVRIINVVDPAMVGDFMNTSEGEELFVNTMRRNSDQLKQILKND